VEGTSKARTEQGYLRRILFGNRRRSSCGICGREFPVAFLVAAHIKKRSECSLKEKRDAENIVMSMCRFGCDDLYERGYIGVSEAKVTRLSMADSTSTIDGYLETICGRVCASWNEERANYFSWHVSTHS